MATSRRTPRKAGAGRSPVGQVARAKGKRGAVGKRTTGKRTAAGRHTSARKQALAGTRTPAGKRAPTGKRTASAKRRADASPPVAKPVAKVARSGRLIELEKLTLAALDDMKAVNVKVLDVRGLTDVADTMIVASGNSDRHVRAIAELVIARAKAAGRRPMGTEGQQDAEWVLVDLQDVLVHIMLPRVREFYALEQLWEAPMAARRSAGDALKGRHAVPQGPRGG